MEWTVDEYNSDDDINDIKHSKLLKTAAATYGKSFQRIQPPSRNEASLEVSEFHLLSKRKKGEDLAKDLASSIDKTGKHSHITQKVKKIQKLSKPLPAPLERPEAEKVKRTVAFDNAKKLLDRWEPIVNANKVTAELHFPLNVPYFRLRSTKSFLSNLKTKTPLEQEIENILSGSTAVKQEKEEDQQRKTFYLNRKEIIEQRRELARIRAQQSYKESKARRQNKIKSKRYHRILRRENTKKQLKEFEELQKSDPEAALKKLEELERTRAEERVTLRHRSTGQWAKNKAVHAKFDKNCRQQLAEQLRLSKDLTQKVRAQNSSDDDDSEEENKMPCNNKAEGDNPWISAGKNEYEEFSSNYRKFWEQQQQNKKKTPETSDKTGSQIHPKDSICEGAEQVTHLKDSSEQTERVRENTHSSNKKSFPNGKTSVQHTNDKSNDVNKKRVIVNGFTVSDIEDSDVDDHITPLNISSSSSEEWKVTEFDSEISDDENNQPIEKRVETKDLDDLFEKMEVYLKDKFQEKASRLKSDFEEKLMPKSKREEKHEKGKIYQKHNSNQKAVELLHPKINDGIVETTGDIIKEIDPFNGIINRKFTDQVIATKKTSKKIDSLEIDPQNLIPLQESSLSKTEVPVISGADDDNEEADDKNNLMTISEAFTEDDVVAEFRQEKEAIVDKDKPKDIDLTLPGWGEWAGKGLEVSKRKKKRFIIKAPKVLPRKDDKLDTVIINENADVKAKAHQVNELPFPYTSLESFEASIRAPLGSTWVPETAHRKLIAPKVTTRLGTVIEPLTEDALINQSKQTKIDEGDKYLAKELQ